MIVFDLECRGGGHRFEGWFASSEAFACQQERGLVACPHCGATDVVKALMAPHLGRKSNQIAAMPPAEKRAPMADAAPAAALANSMSPDVSVTSLPARAREALAAIAGMQAEALKSSRWVGGTFSEDVRAMHYGEKDHELIHGKATPDEARALIEEGIEIAPVLFPIAPPGEVN